MTVKELIVSSSLRVYCLNLQAEIKEGAPRLQRRTSPKHFLKSPNKSFGHVWCLHQVKKRIKHKITLNELVGLQGLEIKHLMGNSEFCFPEILNVPRGEAEGNIQVERKQNSLFPEGPVIKRLSL